MNTNQIDYIETILTDVKTISVYERIEKLH